MNNRSHYQKLLPILATGIFAGAAGILDDFNDPEIEFAISGSHFTVTANEPESGLANLSVYQWISTKGKFVRIADQDEATFEIDAGTDADREFKVVATDYAGNESVKYYLYTAEGGKLYDYADDEAVLSFDTGGGSAYDPAIQKKGEKVNLPVPVREGYTFDGWYTDDTFTTPVTADTKITANMQLVAKWTLIKNDDTVKSPTDSLIDIAGATVDPVKSRTYNGEALTPALAVKLGSAVLKIGTDYTVAYAKNKKIGKATATITGIGKYSGVKAVSFNIIPMATSVSKLTIGKKKLTVKWKKAAAGQAVTGYEIGYRFKTATVWKTVTVTAAKAEIANYKKTISKLRKGIRYQVRIRTYKTVDKVKYFSNWSSLKTSNKIK